MYQKGQWVLHKQRGHAMRVQRDQKPGGPDRHQVWCEWMDGGYHVEVFDEGELQATPAQDWPARE